MSIRIPVFEPKKEAFELEFRLFVPPGQYTDWALVSEPGFLDFQIFDFRDYFVLQNIFEKEKIFQINEFKTKMGLSRRYEKTQPLTRILCFWARKLGSELTPNGIIWLHIYFC